MTPSILVVTGTSGTSRRSPRRGSSGSSNAGNPGAASRARRAPPRSRREKKTKKPPPWEGAVTANSGAGSAPHGAFPPGSAKLLLADGTTRPRRWTGRPQPRSRSHLSIFAVTSPTTSRPEAFRQQFARGPRHASRAILREKFGEEVVGAGTDPVGGGEQPLGRALGRG